MMGTKERTADIDDAPPGLSRRQMILVLASAAVANTVLPPPSNALPEAFPEFEPIPWLPGRTGFLRSVNLGRCNDRYWSAGMAYRETGDCAALQAARYDCLHVIGGALSYPPQSDADVRFQELARDLLAKALSEFPELLWSYDYATHYGYRNLVSWPRRAWFKEGRQSRLVLAAAGYAA